MDRHQLSGSYPKGTQGRFQRSCRWYETRDIPTGSRAANYKRHHHDKKVVPTQPLYACNSLHPPAIHLSMSLRRYITIQHTFMFLSQHVEPLRSTVHSRFHCHVLCASSTHVEKYSVRVLLLRIKLSLYNFITDSQQHIYTTTLKSQI